MEDIYYNWFEGGGFIIRFITESKVHLYEVPRYGGSEQKIGDFLTVEEAKEHADKLC